MSKAKLANLISLLSLIIALTSLMLSMIFLFRSSPGSVGQNQTSNAEAEGFEDQVQYLQTAILNNAYHEYCEGTEEVVRVISKDHTDYADESYTSYYLYDSQDKYLSTITLWIKRDDNLTIVDSKYSCERESE